MTYDQGQAARPALGYRPPAHTSRPPSKARELWGIGEDGAAIEPAAPPASRLDGDISAAAWTIGHGLPEAEWEVEEREHRTAVRKAKTRLLRLRLYSYCMTLSACVLALMAFMYLLTGTADGDATFTSIGVMFLGMMILMLWGALRVTRAGEEA